MDGNELATGKIVEVKEKIRNEEIRQAALKVATYIALAFKNLQNCSVIWLTYNFE